MMNTLLIDSAVELTEEEAGGHSGRWAVIDDDVSELMQHWLGLAISQATVVPVGLAEQTVLEQLISEGEPKGLALLYADSEQSAGSGMLSLIHVKTDTQTQKTSNEFWSAYPFFKEGNEIVAQIDALQLFPHRLEAWLTLSLVHNRGVQMTVFDPLFWAHRSLYRAHHQYHFSVAAMAYELIPVTDEEIIIDDPEKIRQFNARRAWVEHSGSWTPANEEASLAAWQTQAEEDNEPIHISLATMTALFSVKSSDDAEFQGAIITITPRATSILECYFWRIDTLVIRNDEDFILPIYVAERLFTDEWRPEVGQYVKGSVWLQAYAVGCV